MKKLKQKTILKETASICNQRNIKVYPVYSLGNWYIEVNINGNLKRYNKQLRKEEINNAVISTCEYFEKKIKENSFN